MSMISFSLEVTLLCIWNKIEKWPAAEIHLAKCVLTAKSKLIAKSMLIVEIQNVIRIDTE